MSEKRASLAWILCAIILNCVPTRVVAHAPYHVNVSYLVGPAGGPFSPAAGGLIFAACGDEAVVRVHVRMKHFPEEGLDCSCSGDLTTEFGIRPIDVVVADIFGGGPTLSFADGYDCDSSGIVIERDFDFQVSSAPSASDPTVCELSINGSPVGRNLARLRAVLTAGTCEKVEDTCPVVPAPCALDWSDSSSVTDSRKLLVFAPAPPPPPMPISRFTGGRKVSWLASR